jgi:Zn-finger nucleic acid-binding protein
MSRNDCPRCEGRLEHAQRDGLPTRTCSECEGTWVDVLDLETLTRRSASADELIRLFTALAVQELPESRLACPGCAQPLLLGRYGGVEVDACRRCRGLYLDRYELAGVLDRRTTRPCPKCEAPMRFEDLEDVPANACPGCGGLWLDVPVLEHVLAPSRAVEAVRDALIRTLASVTGDGVRATTHPCPTCRGTLSARDHRGIEVDLCFGCRGVFLDRGELQQVAALDASPPERAVAALRAGGGRAIETLVSAVRRLVSPGD